MANAPQNAAKVCGERGYVTPRENQSCAPYRDTGKFVKKIAPAASHATTNRTRNTTALQQNAARETYRCCVYCAGQHHGLNYFEDGVLKNAFRKCANCNRP